MSVSQLGRQVRNPIWWVRKALVFLIIAMLLKASALQNQVVGCGPSLLNLLSHSQIGQEWKKKLNYLFSTLAFSQFLISSRLLSGRLLANHECFPHTHLQKLFFF